MAFKMLRSSLYERSLMATRKERNRRLRQRSNKCCTILKSGSDAPYTERHHVKFGKTKSLKFA